MISTVFDRVRRPLKRVECRVPLLLERAPFVVKTAQNPREFSKIAALRYEVFCREYQGRLFPFGWEFDELDAIGDHLMVIDVSKDRVVGTYRLISSEFSEKFYTETEFNLQAIRQLPGTQLELGRACVHKDYRTGQVITLLWRGLMEYVRKSKADYLFGCSSIKGIDFLDAAELSAQFEISGSSLTDLLVPVQRDYRIPGFSFYLERIRRTKNLRAKTDLGKNPVLEDLRIPPLLKSYLKAGALVSVEPAWDASFRCIDFFTLLSLKDLGQGFERRFGSSNQDSDVLPV